MSPKTHIIIHPKYNPASLRNDIALLILDVPFKLTDNVGLICLSQRERQNVEGTCVATGWGKNSYRKGTYQSILKKLELPLVSKDQCLSSLQQARLGPFFQLHESFICAGGEANKDTCKGDGGSPLICPVIGNSNKFEQVGIVSWGLTCGVQNTPGVYVNVGIFNDWIDRTVESYGFSPNVYKSD
ncbi:hypothetical protein NQ318_009339 [Aromia moschata]|uniref:Peptidase S1 domain-containing protein n=1 Tax=Aromia moschata TaxID=1265417 RepID=A0AAV8XPB2_9CUCU|nr:hypothetical protein NQ318_009339 [Aromia moschata]